MPFTKRAMHTLDFSDPLCRMGFCFLLYINSVTHVH